ncbi:lysis system i-spanin subunit Rz [Gilliamella bombi]|uniref:lysis system i-spanin subunit Rz n=1 Tax=Gilliamella bombi TaxID=1908521 RepID=UPI000A161A81|nr:lysis system i-spanin subunit Rz [Gilliamella bombi]
MFKLSKVNITLISILAFVSYFAYNCWQDKRLAVSRANKAEAKYEKYIQDNNEVKKIESNIIEAIKNGYAKTDALRNDIDNGLVELRVKVESVERDSATTSGIANKALRLAKTSQQDYYNLTNAIEYNKVMIEGWQKYYCKEIAPKNNSQFMCENK